MSTHATSLFPTFVLLIYRYYQMQFSVQLMFVAMTVAALNAAVGIYLLQTRMLTNGLLEFCNSGLFVFAIMLQIALFILVALRADKRITIRRFLIAGFAMLFGMIVLTRVYAESAGRWLWENQKTYATAWTPIEFIASITALLGIPLFCMLSTILTVLLWGAIRTNQALQPSSGGQSTLHNNSTSGTG